MLGFLTLLENPLGPVHDQDVPLSPLSVNVAEAPSQTGPELVTEQVGSVLIPKLAFVALTAPTATPVNTPLAIPSFPTPVP